MTKSFLDALKFTLKWEGGYVNHPDDKGGATNFGITQSTYNAYMVSLGRIKHDVKDITLGEVREIYWRQYWMQAKCEGMPERIGIIVFDTAVLRGAGKSVKMLQSIIVAKVDGTYGFHSAEALLKYVSAHGEGKLVDKLITSRETFHKLRGTIGFQWKFLKGWLNRCKDLRIFVFNLQEEN